MNWFDTSGLTSLAKNALKEAQKTIDKALDIQDDSEEEPEGASSSVQTAKSTPGKGNTPQNETSDFFSSWGLSVSAEYKEDRPIKEQPVVVESPSKGNSQSLWGSFAGSFFEQPKTDDDTIVRPPKAKSMNVICDKYDSQDDLFSKSQLVMSDGLEALDHKKNIFKLDDRRKSSLTNALSFVSSRNSSDSVEVLSQSLKTTPDSEAASYQSVSQSSSIGLKPNSESVEILPDSLISPSSIECLGFDSYTSDRNSSTSSNVTPTDSSDKKSTSLGDKTEKVGTADSVSLVADDDEDTMSYNSISECTAPTVFDADGKTISPFPKISKLDQRKPDLLSVEQLVSQRMHISENSSNDGSWSDRTLNADNDSLTIENIEESKKDAEDMSIEKLSDSSSFYNLNLTGDLIRSDCSFVNIERQSHSPLGSNDSSQKDCSIKERISPISSDSKSDLVKIGSDRTSGHTSGDEVETATSSDIEIIPSPNGDSGHGCRNSPGKFKLKADGTTSPNLVDLVLGRNLATKIRGHTRELSDASIKSNTSDESQSSENERLMRRLSEMAEILDARENRLMEVSRNNAELAETNAHLKSQMDNLLAKHDTSDINTITEDYTQRMSALEKKFQQAIREKDQLRKQLDTLKQEIAKRSTTSTETLLKERDDMITQLQEEGEKLAGQELQHTNIIKKLRVQERDNEQVIKSLRDKIAEQSSELDRMKRSLAAKDDSDSNQIEEQLRKQFVTLKQELAKNKSGRQCVEILLNEKDDMIAQLQREGEKLASQELQQSNIIKKLRAKEKDNELVIKGLRDKTAELSSELDRMKRSLAAKEELEVSQIEAVYRLTITNKKLETELLEAKNELLDALEHLAASRASLDALRGEADALRRGAADAAAVRRDADEQRAAVASASRRADVLQHELGQLRAERAREEQRWMAREEALRREVQEAREAAGAAHSAGAADCAPAALLQQVAALQAAALHHERARAAAVQRLAEAETLATKTAEREKLTREENQTLHERLAAAEGAQRDAESELHSVSQHCRTALADLQHMQTHLQSKTQELEELKNEKEKEKEELEKRLSEVERLLEDERAALDTERKRNAILQEQLSPRAASPAPSAASDTLSSSLWNEDACGSSSGMVAGAVTGGVWLPQVAGGEPAALAERRALRRRLAALAQQLQHAATVQEQYDALLQMYGEKEEQVAELRLDLHDVTQLYKAQLHELITLRERHAGRGPRGEGRDAEH